MPDQDSNKYCSKQVLDELLTACVERNFSSFLSHVLAYRISRSPDRKAHLEIGGLDTVDSVNVGTRVPSINAFTKYHEIIIGSQDGTDKTDLVRDGLEGK